jgi:hypothetical protein
MRRTSGKSVPGLRLLPQAEEWVQERLRWENWELLCRETVDFAKGELRRRRWRGSRDGVLPGGYDADALAAEAIAQLLAGRCRLPPGFLRVSVRGELQRLVRDKIRSLHRLKEAAGTRSEWEVVPLDEAAEPASVFDLASGGLCSSGFQAVSGREEEERRERLRTAFQEFLKGEPYLLEVFGCWCSGVTRPAEIARRLGMTERAVAAARKRLERRIAQFEGGEH